MTLKKKRLSGSQKILGGVFFIILPATLAISLWAAPQKQTNPGVNGGPDGEPAVDATRVYDTVAANKSLLTSPRFKVVDDFNGREWKNRLGAYWRLENAKAGQVALEHPKEDARGLKPGYSLKTRFDLHSRQQFTVYSSLEKLDMSRAQFLAMKCKVAPDPRGKFNGQIQVTITDWTGKSESRDITDSCSESADWNDVVLPMGLFEGLDFDQLHKISFTVTNTGERSQAALWLDEIAFFGPHEVGFESTLDNIKGFPKTVLDTSARQELLKLEDKKFLDRIGRSTWRYFEDAADKKTNLVLDHVKVGKFPMVGLYTSPTNIAMDLISTVAARELGYISGKEAEKRVKAVLKSLQELKKWNGCFYNFYETSKLSVSREFVSSIDNGWLVAALMIVRQAFTGKIAETATGILDGIDFGQFFDPENDHMVIGFDVARNGLTPYHYGIFVTEARVMSFIGIGKGDLPSRHWWRLYRTAPDAWEWQTQKPSGKWKERDGVEYFQGFYIVDDQKIVPSWGGSLFEFLMPTIVIPEKKLAPSGLGANGMVATELHIRYALNEKEYPVWGISPAAVSDGRRWQYGEYGIRKLGVKGYPDKEVLAPHVSFLALETMPEAAIQNLRRFLVYDIYGEYGFYDSIVLRREQVTHQYLALDQGMSLIAIANYLKNGVIQNYFIKDPIAQKAKGLLEGESFFE